MLSYEINTNYHDIEEIIPDIHDIFENNGSTIYKIRNEIKVIEIKGHSLCIKKFAQPNLINKVAYAYFRKAKAKRSYYNALKLSKIGVLTPEPICWIEFRNKAGFITGSYYISSYQKHDFTLAKVFNNNLPDKEQIIKDFAYYACNILHKKGVKHLDLGQGNVLVTKKEKGYYFYLVDINRIRFNDEKIKRNGFSNLKRLGGSPIEMSILAHYYAKARKSDPTWGIIKLNLYKLRYHNIRTLRKRLTAPIKNLYLTLNNYSHTN